MALPTNAATPSTTSRRLPCLDGLRACAVAVVMINHGRTHGRFPNPKWVPPFNGLGASLFFLLSGFLVTTLLLSEKDKVGFISLRKFYYRRALRILPASYVFIAAAIFLRFTGWTTFSQWQLLACLTLWSNVMGGTPAWILGHLWSLSLQEQYYLIWPVVIGFLGRRRSIFVTVATIVGWPLLRYLRRGYLFAGAGHEALTTAGMDTILWGCMLALMIRSRRPRRILEQMAARPIGLYVSGISLWFLYATAGHWSRHETFLLPLLRNLVLCWFVWWCANNPKHWFGRLLQSRPLVLMGQMSYSLYLWQQPFLGLYRAWICHFPQNLIAIFSVASLSYYWIERPCDRIRRSLSPTREVLPGGKASRSGEPLVAQPRRGKIG
jgi:peptidoglycan/LPS O-acetylase OafA/YrhL